MARNRTAKLWPACVVAAALITAGTGACSDNTNDDIVVLSLDPPATAEADENAMAPAEDTARDPGSDDSGGTEQAGSGDSFVTEAVAGANAAEQDHIPTQTPTLIPRTPTTAQTTPPRPTAAPAGTPDPTNPQAQATQPGSSQTATAEPEGTQPDPDPTRPVDGRERPGACSDGFERVYEAFASDSPPIGIAICVAADGRAEYLGLDVGTNNRIRLSACVEGANFVANNGGSLYVIDIGQDMITYPQAPAGRHLDTVTMITSAATIPALGC